MKSLVSVIVPVYNAEKYLVKCLDSILSQSYSNIEILLINDGSKDNSGSICDEYARKDIRIKVFHKENGGVSSARNVGIENFKGDYVCFVDSDDYVDRDYIKVMIDNIDDFDCVAIGMTKVSGVTGECIESFHHSSQEYTTKAMFIEAYCNDGMLGQMFFGPYCKLYKADIVRSNYFDETMVSGEDIVFNLNCLTLSNKIKLIDYVGYYLVKHDQSATNMSALSYSPRSEHGYTIIAQNIENARRNLGVSEDRITRHNINPYFLSKILLKNPVLFE